MTPQDRATLIAWVKAMASWRKREIQARQSYDDPPNQLIIAALTEDADRLDAIAALLEAEAWQPIATAPKDGTKVLIAFPEYGVGPALLVSAAAWYGDEEGEEFGWKDDPYVSPSYFPPTYWKPLPAAPVLPAPPVTEAKP